MNNNQEKEVNDFLKEMLKKKITRVHFQRTEGATFGVLEIDVDSGRGKKLKLKCTIMDVSLTGMTTVSLDELHPLKKVKK